MRWRVHRNSDLIFKMPQVVKWASINKFDSKISSHANVFTPNEWKAHKMQTSSFHSRTPTLFLTLAFVLSISLSILLSFTRSTLCLYYSIYRRTSHKQHSAMNNRMLLKAFKTISKVVLFHTKYLWCSCVSSSFVTVLVFVHCMFKSFRKRSARANEQANKREREQEKRQEWASKDTKGIGGSNAWGGGCWGACRVWWNWNALCFIRCQIYTHCMMTWAMW